MFLDKDLETSVNRITQLEDLLTRMNLQCATEDICNLAWDERQEFWAMYKHTQDQIELQKNKIVTLTVLKYS